MDHANNEDDGDVTVVLVKVVRTSLTFGRWASFEKVHECTFEHLQI